MTTTTAPVVTSLPTQSTIDANFNATECLVKMSHFGYTEVHNICRQTSQSLPWGFFDWIGTLGLIALGLGGITLLFGFAYVVIRDRY